MSGNGFISSQQPNASPAIDVGFSSLADPHVDSKPRPDSRSSGKKSDRSARRREREHERKRRKEDEGSPNSLTYRARKSGGFLLDSMFTSGSSQGSATSREKKRKPKDGQLRMEKQRSSHGRPSGDSSIRSSPLSRELSHDGPSGGQERPRRASTRAQSQGMDTAQLVQMALNLSESRKRHVSNTLAVPLPSNRRSTPGPVSNYDTVKRASTSRQRRSRQSDDWSRDSPSSVYPRAATENVSLDEIAQDEAGDDHVFYTFSPATLSRAEKARKYFELASEYRRLLQHLPPLKPDAYAPGNFAFETSVTPGTPHPQIYRVQSSTENKHELGRQYNPIQALRDRRIRVRERRPFTAPPDAWQDVDTVRGWIEEVEEATEDLEYRPAEDTTRLPRFSGDTAGTERGPTFGSRRRTDTIGSVITRPENSWTIEPTELLADAYWTEQGDNKGAIETRRGNPLFPHHSRHSVDAPKISVEMHRGRDDIPEAASNDGSADESERRPRRRRLMLPLKGDKGKHRRLISRSPSSNSGTSDDGGRPRGLKRTETDANLGPLERHMRELIAKEEKGELNSPDATSPDHWGSANAQFQKSRASIDQSKHESVSRPSVRGSLDVPRDDHRRSKSADGRVGSIDNTMQRGDYTDPEPVSPVEHDPSRLSGDSYVGEKRDSLSTPRLPAFRSPSKDRNNIGQTDFATASKGSLYTIPSIGSGRPRPSVDQARPSGLTRHHTSSSVSGSMRRTDSNSTGGTLSSFKEPGSTVGRFFKGRWVGDLVRNDSSRFGGRFKSREKIEHPDQTDASVSDDAEIGPKSLKRTNTDPTDELPSDGRHSMDSESAKPKYHLNNLPAFTSSGRDKRQIDSPYSTGPDPITRQLKAQREAGQQDRFKTLAPPRIDVSSETASQQTVKPDQVDDEDGRPTDGKLDGRRGLMFANDSHPSLSHRTSSYAPNCRPDQRHWSISDNAPQAPISTTVTRRDIAHARTLLLSTGIKAREIHLRATQPTDPPMPFLAIAAHTASKPLPTDISKQDVALAAARLLSTHLDSAHASFDTTLSTFQTTTAKTLAHRLEDLTARASSQLTTLVHETSDAADAFTVQLTTGHPQQTKSVDDAVDAMWRRRRRRLRLLRSVGFKALEWFTLGIMWAIWAVVVGVNLVRRVVVGTGRVVRWLVVP